MIPLDKAIVTKEMLDAATDALANEPPLFGESVSRFENDFARFCGTAFAVSTGSGTDALSFILRALGVKGSMVLTSPMTYIATANAAVHAGAEPVFCDVEYASGNIAPEAAGRAIAKGRRIKALVPVHLHGIPARMDDLNGLAERKGILVVEDACQAHGALYGGRRAGGMAHAAAFSFNPFKNMTVCGEGGMVTTNDEKLAQKVRALADSGRETPYTHEHAIIGFSSRMSSVSAAIGMVQLRHLEEWNDDRRRIARMYSAALAGIPGISLPPPESARMKPAYNKFAIRLPGREARDAMKESLRSQGVECDSHFPIPVHLQPPYRAMGHAAGEFPDAERFADTTLSLPMYVGMTEDEIKRVCTAIGAASA